MGKVNQGILGALSGSVGHVTGASIKGIPTLRTKALSVANPKTASQMVERSSFAEASTYCRENREAILEQEHFKEKKGMSIWNQMISWYRNGGRLEPTLPYPTIMVDGVECIDGMAAGFVPETGAQILDVVNVINVWDADLTKQGILWFKDCDPPADNYPDVKIVPTLGEMGGHDLVLSDNGFGAGRYKDVSDKLIGKLRDADGNLIDKWPIYLDIPHIPFEPDYYFLGYVFDNRTFDIKYKTPIAEAFEGTHIVLHACLYDHEDKIMWAGQIRLEKTAGYSRQKWVYIQASEFVRTPLSGSTVSMRVFFLGGTGQQVMYANKPNNLSPL